MALPLGTILDEQASADDERTIRRDVSAFGDQYTDPRNWRPVGLTLERFASRGIMRSTARERAGC